MSNAFVGQISMFGGNFAPRNFMFCNGQLLSISQYQALFSLIGTTYGGDGVQTFALPNLQSRIPLHEGTGPGQPTYVLGQSAGSEFVTIMQPTMPAHTHTPVASTAPATATNVGSTVIPATVSGPTAGDFYAAQVQGQPVLPIVSLDGHSATLAGGSQQHNNLMPSLAVSFIIAVFGVFPSRN